MSGVSENDPVQTGPYYRTLNGIEPNSNCTGSERGLLFNLVVFHLAGTALPARFSEGISSEVTLGFESNLLKSKQF